MIEYLIIKHHFSNPTKDCYKSLRQFALQMAFENFQSTSI